MLLIRNFINEQRSARINVLRGKLGRMLGWREGMLWCEGSPPAQQEMFLALSLGCGTIWGHPWSPQHVELGAVTSGRGVLPLLPHALSA